MKRRELLKLGYPPALVKPAFSAIAEAARAGMTKKELRRVVRHLVSDPAYYVDHGHFGELARHLLAPSPVPGPRSMPRNEPIPFAQWGERLEEGAVAQMANACRLPISVQGALMPDAHQGYGLPIGGVLATDGAVIPYAVGVDIACRMKMSVLDLPPRVLDGERERLRRVLEQETRFGVGASFRKRREHAVMDSDWSVSPVTWRARDKAWAQLGTSGSGNHFVEFGLLHVERRDTGLLDPGVYLALLSHSGSRGTGSLVATHYSRLAQKHHPGLPRELRHLAWLDLDSKEGLEYWQAMQLMGAYAAANHELIHRHIVRALGARVLVTIENHHNFAWRETLPDGRKVVVHRKGATPAARGVPGIIPGSMATPAYLVRGRGHPLSLNSAAHGAGRKMSRKRARETTTWSRTRKLLADRGVELISAGLDETPLAYKDIDTVMAQQSDLVEVLARFDPKLVKMAPEGERPED